MGERCSTLDTPETPVAYAVSITGQMLAIELADSYEDALLRAKRLRDQYPNAKVLGGVAYDEPDKLLKVGDYCQAIPLLGTIRSDDGGIVGGG